MNKNHLSKDINKEICNGYGCYKKAKEKLTLNAGKFGYISLYLCYECKYKFQKEA